MRQLVQGKRRKENSYVFYWHFQFGEVNRYQLVEGSDQMKVFVSGIKRIKKEGGKWALPESVCAYLDELMADEAEIFVDDQSIVAALVQD